MESKSKRQKMVGREEEVDALMNWEKSKINRESL
jgi:hypothetical protein